MNGWSRSSPRSSRKVAASASVRATMMPGTCMTSSWKREVFSRLICSSTPTIPIHLCDVLCPACQQLPTFVPALLGAGLLVLDVVAGDPCLDESADQIPDVRV